MTAQQLHLDRTQLSSIIQATLDHKAEMDRLNNQVQALAGVINANMNSDAGKIMNTRLAEWTTEYGALAADLNELNTRVQGVLNALISADSGATGSANH
jgi:hypothetical protein